MLTYADVCAGTRSDANTQYHAAAAAQLCELEQIAACTLNALAGLDEQQVVRERALDALYRRMLTYADVC
jgi:hypothetical protein